MKKITMIFSLLFVLYSTVPAQTNADTEKEKEGIRNCALDYGDGFYSGAADRMANALHPELNKVLITRINPTGKMILQYSTVSGLIEMTRGKTGFLAEDKRKENVTILDIEGNIACARINTSSFNDYLQLIKTDDGWKILSVLWTFGPDSPQRPAVKDYNYENEKEAVSKTALNFCEGLLNNDAEKYSSAVNAETNVVQLSAIASTGKAYVSKFGAGMLAELFRNKLMRVPDDKKNVEVKILDTMDGYAFVKGITPAIDFYLQIAKIDDKWEIVNALFARKVTPAKK
jgi:hypothetical protein